MKLRRPRARRPCGHGRCCRIDILTVTELRRRGSAPRFPGPSSRPAGPDRGRWRRRRRARPQNGLFSVPSHRAGWLSDSESAAAEPNRRTPPARNRRGRQPPRRHRTSPSTQKGCSGAASPSRRAPAPAKEGVAARRVAGPGRRAPARHFKSGPAFAGHVSVGCNG